MLLVTLLALSLAATEPVPTPASAAEPAPPTAAKTKAERDKEKVCIDVAPTGSVITKKVCKTRKQWRQLQEAQRRAGESMLDTGSSNQTRRE